MRERLEWPQFGTTDNERRLIQKYERRIAALEAALKHAHCPHRAPAISVEECINVGWCGVHQKCEICQALTSSEGETDD